MIVIDIVKRTLKVVKTLLTPSPATKDVRFESMHHPERYRGEHQIDYETCIG